jgi:hypothetical protein
LFTGNLVNHVTFFTNSDELWATFTETGSVQATDDGTGVTYSGHATAWGNFNMNEKNSNSAFTLTIHLSGSDGSSITAHETTVFSTDANGDVTVNFDKFNLSCGQRRLRGPVLNKGGAAYLRDSTDRHRHSSSNQNRCLFGRLALLATVNVWSTPTNIVTTTLR